MFIVTYLVSSGGFARFRAVETAGQTIDILEACTYGAGGAGRCIEEAFLPGGPTLSTTIFTGTLVPVFTFTEEASSAPASSSTPPGSLSSTISSSASSTRTPSSTITTSRTSTVTAPTTSSSVPETSTVTSTRNVASSTETTSATGGGGAVVAGALGSAAVAISVGLMFGVYMVL